MHNLLFISILAIIYLIAAIPTGVLLSQVMGYEDVRQKGSGNIGATNVYRVGGKLAGLLTLAGDILKGYLPLLAFKYGLSPAPDQMAIACCIAILGHCYPVYLGFKGGKGVATGLGILLVLSPWAVAGASLVFLISVAISRFISVGSILAALSAPVLVLMLNHPQPYFLATVFIAMLITWRHRSNIKRLLDGSENRFKA